MTAYPDADVEPPRSERAWLAPLKLGVVGTLLIFTLGATAGATAAALERGWSGLRLGVVAGLAVLTLALAAWLVRILRNRPQRGQEARNIGTARRLTIASGAIGGVLGLMLAAGGIAGGDEPASLMMFSNAPLPPLLAAGVIAAIVLVIPLSWVWHRSIDEHESAAYRFGALIGINVYFFLSTLWWIAARGGFVPASDGVAIFMTTVAAWGLGWAWARYR